MSRVYNFSAGPAVLPETVLKEVADEMMDYQGSGMSVMEMSHRSPEFQKIIDDAEKDLRDLMNIPDNYKVLFLQGGASQQFAMIPMNLMKNRVADYIVTGQWAKKAYQEAQKYGKVNKIASSEDKTFSYIPDCSDLPISPDADYVYICENNTIYGTKFKTANTVSSTVAFRKTSDLPAWLSRSFVKILLQRMFFREHQPCLHTRHMQMQDLFTIHQTHTASMYAAKSSNGSRLWADWKKCRREISKKQRSSMIIWIRANSSKVQ